MTSVYVVTGNCGDYYCDGMHLLAVAATEDEAKALAQQARERPRFMDSMYDDVSVSGPLVIGELVAAEFNR